MRLREPTEIQRAALGAALLKTERAVPAFRRLEELTGGLDSMDAATFRMLPMVYRNLKDAGLTGDELSRLKGIYRQSWYRNRLAVGAAMKAVVVLRTAGVEPVALKGLGLIATAYPEAALRPMHDVDMLIPPPNFRRAAVALLDAGWQPLRGDRTDYFRRVRVFHAMPLIGPDGVEVDLHRRMLEENGESGIDSTALTRSRIARIGDDEVTTLSPEDHVINACVHGVRWDPTPALRWALDAAMVVRAAEESFDWDYLVTEARDRGVSLAVAAALDFLRDYEPMVPDTIIAGLRTVPASRLERIDFRAQQGGMAISTQTLRYVTRYGRMASGRGPVRLVREFPTYLECMWELDRPAQVPLDGAKRVWRRLRPS